MRSKDMRLAMLTKQGNKLARTALVHCGLVAKRYSPYLSRFYERIKQRRGGGKAKSLWPESCSKSFTTL
jgi:transposase